MPTRETPLPDASEIRLAFRLFREDFAAAKLAEGGDAFDWYPYDSLGSFELAMKLLRSDFFGTFISRRALDIGCGDGANAFLLNSLGFEVTAVDLELFNHNQMRGIRALRGRFSPPIAIRSMNLDVESMNEDAEYGFALALGLLYHLKSPIHFLESLSLAAEYCLLSTRVVRDVTGGALTPNAYLVDITELGADETNYWLFTPKGVERVLERSGWQMLESRLVESPSDPADLRLYCVAKSLRKRQWVGLAGLHATEEHGWRWTRAKFSLRVRAERGVPGRLRLQVVLPEAVFAAVGLTTLRTSVAGHVDEHRLSAAGAHTVTLAAFVPAEGFVDLSVELDRWLPATAEDGRELGLILAGVEWVRP